MSAFGRASGTVEANRGVATIRGMLAAGIILAAQVGSAQSPSPAPQSQASPSSLSSGPSSPPSTAPAQSPPAGLEAALAFPFAANLVAAERADRVAWVATVKGVRNVWTAAGPDFRAAPLTDTREDDGEELSGLVLSPDGTRAVWTRGGDHDANWPAEGNLQPDAASDPETPRLTIWSAATAGGAPVKIGEGDAPAISGAGRIAFLKDGKVWSASASGDDKPELLFFDRGTAEGLVWSPNGSALAFVSRRSDHSFVGVFDMQKRSIAWLSPSTAWDETPVWSPDGRRIAFTRRPGTGGAPEPFLSEVPHPWSIEVADAATGERTTAWRSPRTLEGSFPEVPDGVFLRWGAGNRLTFRAEMDGWPHLYSVPASGGTALLLTPGPFMVEHVALDPDGRTLLYDANAGPAAEDDDRRHVFRVAVDRAQPAMISHGTGIEWMPVETGAGHIAYIASGATRPIEVRLADGGGRGDGGGGGGGDGRGDVGRRGGGGDVGRGGGGNGGRGGGERVLGASASGYAASLVTPRRVTFESTDGLLIHGQLFEPARHPGKRPALIFVHGGPPRQMLLGFPFMEYYARAYAMNQYLASRGFVVLSVNYRLGIGYGRAFQHPAKSGPAGAAEYRDVQAGARFLQCLPRVDRERLGIWGGSYGGYLTALALARDSVTFKAGVDFHGVHDWSRLMAEEETPPKRYEQGDWQDFLKVAYESSPVADVATWHSPVLLIHGDDDRNVRFNQTIDLVARLDQRGVPYEELVLPNEIHGFLRHRDWLQADAAAVRFLEAKLGP